MRNKKKKKNLEKNDMNTWFMWSNEKCPCNKTGFLLGYRWTWNTVGFDQLVYTCGHVYVLLVGCNGTSSTEAFVVEEILDNHANRKL